MGLGGGGKTAAGFAGKAKDLTAGTPLADAGIFSVDSYYNSGSKYISGKEEKANVSSVVNAGIKEGQVVKVADGFAIYKNGTLQSFDPASAGTNPVSFLGSSKQFVFNNGTWAEYTAPAAPAPTKAVRATDIYQNYSDASSADKAKIEEAARKKKMFGYEDTILTSPIFGASGEASTTNK